MVSSFEPFGFQTGTKDRSELSSYATSMVYNQRNRQLTITGGTYGDYFHPGFTRTDGRSDADCFIAVQHLRDPTRLSWTRRKTFGNPEVSEFCSDIQGGSGGKYFVIGHSGEHGILSDLLPSGNVRQSEYGMIMDVDANIDISGGLILHSHPIQYPVAITASESGDEIFLAEIVSDIKPQVNQSQSDEATGNVGRDRSASAYNVPVPDLNFYVRLQKITSSLSDPSIETTETKSTSTENLKSHWSRQFGTMGMQNVQVSTLDYVSPSALVMTGFTRGEGDAVGGRSSNVTQGMLESFITMIDPSSGNITLAHRVELAEEGNTTILGSCLGHVTNEFYIVGMTSGIFNSEYLVKHDHDSAGDSPLYAFIQKINLEQMKVMWSRQVGAILDNAGPGRKESKDTQIHALACAITPDGDEVFMAGNVMDGASLAIRDGTTFASAGGTDIFVSKFDTKDGRLQFATQIGSSGDDSLAARKSLATDSEGNLIVLGNTNGSMFREKSRQTTTDIFIMSIGREEGNFTSPLDNDVNLVVESYSFSAMQQHQQQKEYEGFYIALLAMIGLLFVLISATLLALVKKAQHGDKGKAIGEASTVLSSASSAYSDYDRKGISLGHSTSPSHSVGPPSMAKHSSSRSSQVRHVELPLVSSTRTIASRESLGSVLPDIRYESISTVTGIRTGHTQMPRGSHRQLQPPSRTTSNKRRTHESVDNRSQQTDNSMRLYEEIYDLLSRASERLDYGSDIDSDSFETTMPHQTTQQRVKILRMKFDDDLDLELI